MTKRSRKSPYYEQRCNKKRRRSYSQSPARGSQDNSAKIRELLFEVEQPRKKKRRRSYSQSPARGSQDEKDNSAKIRELLVEVQILGAQI